MNNVLYKTELPPVEGFNLTFYALVEDIPLEDAFDDSVDDIKELYNKLERYDAVYFCAKVSAYKAGIELGSSYLGACYYDDYEQFINDGDYIKDMTDEAIGEAKRTLKELTE